MTENLTPDLCVIGAGSAGLSVAAGAAQMGAETVLIEADRMGGDCLNTGCVPSKSLLAAAKAVKGFRGAAPFVPDPGAPMIDFKAAHDHVHGVIAAIEPHDSEERFTKLGCTVIRARARFTSPRTVEAGDIRITAKRFVVATGSRAAVPPIPGLEAVPYLTNETVFGLREAPKALVVIGAGPIGCEMAQAFRRLGAEVTVLDIGPMLPKDDPEAAEVVRQALQADGVVLRERIAIERIEKTSKGVSVRLSGDETVTGTHLLVATGRKANVEDMGLEDAGIEYDQTGITVDARLRTCNRRVFAAGDVCGGPQFTHVAGYHAGIIIRNALFRLPAKVDLKALPWVTYTDPELAQVGLTEAEARQRFGESVRVLRADFADNDRAKADRHTQGFAKAVTDKRGRILGATIVGPQAGELIQTWGLAIHGGLKIGAIAGMIAPYPTLGEINKRVAGGFYTPTLFSERTRSIVRLLGKLP